MKIQIIENDKITIVDIPDNCLIKNISDRKILIEGNYTDESVLINPDETIEIKSVEKDKHF